MTNFSISLHVQQEDTHVHFIMFMGRGVSNRARAGELVLLKDEFLCFLEALREHPEVEEVTVVYMGAGDPFRPGNHKETKHDD